MTAWTLFHNPITLSFDGELWLLLPLLAGVAIVYKAIRVKYLRDLPREILILMGYMVGGLAVLCVGLWLVHEYWP